jgi:hypothetical protein
MDWFKPILTRKEEIPEAILAKMLSENARADDVADAVNFDEINWSWRDKLGRTLLVKAILDSSLDVLKLLILKGAKFLTESPSPLEIAVLSKRMDMVQYLIEIGCDVNAKNDSGFSILHSAGIKGYGVMIALLLQNGAKPITYNVFGKSTVDDCKYSEDRLMILFHARRITAFKDCITTCRGLPLFYTVLPFELYCIIVLQTIMHAEEFKQELLKLIRVLSDRSRIINSWKPICPDEIMDYCNRVLA